MILNLSGMADIPEVSGDFTTVHVSLVRAVSADPSQWSNPDTLVTVELEVSDGEAYEFGGAFSASGGIHTDKSGVEMPTTAVRFTYPRVMRHVKGTITVTNGPLVSTLTLAVD